jgi:SRSO17 transposase
MTLGIKTGAVRWLLIERIKTSGAVEYKYHLSSMPKDVAIRKLIISAHLRWKIEQGYQQLKEELGLDHFEGRSWTGFHHRVTLCFMAYVFLQILLTDFAERSHPIS